MGGTGGGTKGFGKTDVDHHSLVEEGAGPLPGPVDELVWHHQVQGRELFLEAAHGTMSTVTVSAAWRQQS